MMAETEVSKVSEVATTKERSELGMSSYQDPTKLDCNGTSHHNQANDHKNSYIYVTKADGLNDDVIVNKDVIAGVSSVSPKSNATVDNHVPELDAENEKLDAVNGEVSELLNGEVNGNVEWTDEYPPLKMMAETEVPKLSEVATTEERYELGMNTYQDPTKPDCNGISHHNQATDHKNSYIYVTEANGLNDDVIVNKDVIVGGSNVSPESNTTVDDHVPELDAQNEKLDAVNWGENGNVEWSDEYPPLVSRNAMKQESFLVGGDGFQVCFANSLKEHNNKTESWVDVVKNPRKLFNVKVKPGFPSFSATSSREITGDVSITCRSITCRTEVFDSFDVKNGSASNIVLETENVKDMGDQLDTATGCCKEKLFQPENEETGNVVELWNTDDKFRQEFVKFSTRSTVRRLGTLDGRSLGPDVEPPILPSYVHERVDMMVSKPAKVDSVSQIPLFLELKQETTVENVISDDKMLKRMRTRKNKKVGNKGTTEPVQGNGLVMVSGRDVTDEVQKEDPKKPEKDVELTRKAQEIRRKEGEAKLKEQHRLEELAKANEARERKKRQAEKAQMRAELKSQKEAEQKEKEREKRLRKKERKKAATRDVHDINNNCETAAISDSGKEISKDIDCKDTSSVILKRPQKPRLSTKQSKTKSVPLPLRNRNKKIYRQLMWVGLISLVIFALLWLRNIGVFSNVELNWRSLN